MISARFYLRGIGGRFVNRPYEYNGYGQRPSLTRRKANFIFGFAENFTLQRNISHGEAVYHCAGQVPPCTKRAPADWQVLLLLFLKFRFFNHVADLEIGQRKNAFAERSIKLVVISVAEHCVVFADAFLRVSLVSYRKIVEGEG